MARLKGAINLDTKELRGFIDNLLTKNTQQIESDFLALDAKDRVSFFCQLLKYRLPRLNAITVEEPQEPEKKQDFSKLTTEELKTIISLMEKVEEV